MAQHTAVELLFESLWNTPKDKLNWYAIRKEAMELEKDQILNAYDDGYDDGEGLHRRNPLGYYKETFDK